MHKQKNKRENKANAISFIAFFFDVTNAQLLDEKKKIENKKYKAILAQSVERTALNRVVEGSIPSDRDSFFLFSAPVFGTVTTTSTTTYCCYLYTQIVHPFRQMEVMSRFVTF